MFNYIQKLFYAAGVVFLSAAALQTGGCSAGSAENEIYNGKTGGKKMNGIAENTLIWDVRTPEEFAGSHVAGAENHPYDQISASSLPENRNAPIYLYCRSGRRASIAMEKLRTLGHQGKMENLQTPENAAAVLGRQLEK